MNFRTCRYFLTVCEAGTMSAAARRLYISQQSLSEHIRKLEAELGVQLFHRDNPLALTEAGQCFRRTAREILDALERMDAELSALRERMPDTLTIGCVDYGTPDFLVPLTELFLQDVPNVLLQTRELTPGEALPAEIPLFISARALGGPFRSELLQTDELVICLRDDLLRRQYGDEWRARRARLRGGDLTALEGCPFVRHRNTPLEALSDMAFEKNNFTPAYLPLAGSTDALMRICQSGQAAITTFRRAVENIPGFPPVYSIPRVPARLPTTFISWRPSEKLDAPARRFLELTQQYFHRRERES